MRFLEFSGEWKTVKIGTITTKVGSGVTPRGGETVYRSQGHPFVRSQNVGWGRLLLNDIAYIDEETHKKQLNTALELNDILLNITGASIGRCAVVNKMIVNGNVNQHVCIIRSNEAVDPEFLCNYLLSNYGQKQIDSFQAGGNRQGLNFEQIKSIRISIPTLDEQKYIAKLLFAINQRIETQNKIIDKLETLIKGIVDTIFTANKFPKVPFKEIYVRAGEGGTPATSNPEYYDNGTIPFIKIDDLQNKYIKTNKDCITELGLQKSSAWIVPANSIIYSNGATIGAISINLFPVCTKQGILGVVPKADINVEFLYYFMTSTAFTKAVERIVTEGTMRTAYLKDINHILCPVPCSVKQDVIAKLLSTLSEKLENEVIFQMKLQKQKEFLLSQMFI